MVDLNKEAKKKATFVSSLRKSAPFIEGARRDQFDVLRTAFWYSDIEHRLGCCSSYQIERTLEPEAFRNRESPYHLNKWRRYRIGADTPRAALVERVDKNLPGTAALLNHPLWEALRGRKPVKRLLREEMPTLVPAIQQMVFDSDEFGSTPSQLIWPISRARLSKIERRAGIDSLACLTILLRAAVEIDKEQAFDIARSLYRVLLMACVPIPLRQWAGVLFLFYREGLFSLVNTEKHQFDFDGFDFAEAVLRLNMRVLQLEDENLIGGTRKDSVTAMWKLITGGYGLNMWRSFEPPIRWEDGKTIEEWFTKGDLIKDSSSFNK